VTYLLDTHAFVWHALNDAKLPDPVRATIDDPANDVAVSIASLWEIGIKSSIGKWPLPVTVVGLQSLAQGQSIEIVPITIDAIHQTSSMDWFNKDPFDRIIAATALIRGDILVTIEQPFKQWGLHVFW
jgi:PIN domain nuclease of toxin-antitoxin system